MKFEWDERKNQAKYAQAYTKTNLKRLDAMTDDMIDTSDIPPLTDQFFATAKWRMPQPKVKITVEVEQDIMEWFKLKARITRNICPPRSAFTRRRTRCQRGIEFLLYQI